MKQPFLESPAAAATPAIDVKGLLLGVVADKTGYPADMLDLSMELEADLGIDSIKRVEILSAMQEQAPDLPEVDPAELAKLATLQQIVDRMGAALGSASSSKAPSGDARWSGRRGANGRASSIKSASASSNRRSMRSLARLAT